MVWQNQGGIVTLINLVDSSLFIFSSGAPPRALDSSANIVFANSGPPLGLVCIDYLVESYA